MRNFDYQTPTRLIFGKGVVAEKLQGVMAQFGDKVLITYGGGSIKRSGLYDQVLQLLAGKEIYELPGIEPNPKFNPSVIEGDLWKSPAGIVKEYRECLSLTK